MGSVVIGTKMAEESCMAMLKYGYKFLSTSGNVILFKKELGE